MFEEEDQIEENCCKLGWLQSVRRLKGGNVYYLIISGRVVDIHAGNDEDLICVFLETPELMDLIGEDMWFLELSITLYRSRTLYISKEMMDLVLWKEETEKYVGEEEKENHICIQEYKKEDRDVSEKKKDSDFEIFRQVKKENLSPHEYVDRIYDKSLEELKSKENPFLMNSEGQVIYQEEKQEVIILEDKRESVSKCKGKKRIFTTSVDHVTGHQDYNDFCDMREKEDFNVYPDNRKRRRPQDQGDIYYKFLNLEGRGRKMSLQSFLFYILSGNQMKNKKCLFVVESFLRYVTYNGCRHVVLIDGCVVCEFPLDSFRLKEVFEDWYMYMWIMYYKDTEEDFLEEDWFSLGNIAHSLGIYYDGLSVQGKMEINYGKVRYKKIWPDGKKDNVLYEFISGGQVLVMRFSSEVSRVLIEYAEDCTLVSGLAFVSNRVRDLLRRTGYREDVLWSCLRLWIWSFREKKKENTAWYYELGKISEKYEN